MKDFKIGVIFGGPSNEREISIRSGRAVSEALRKKGYSVVDIGETGSIEEGILKNKIDVAFIVLHGRYGEDGTIQTFLDNNGIPYTGSDPFASKIALDKDASKNIFVKNKIPTPNYIVLKQGDSLLDIIDTVQEKLSFPVVVKPAEEGSSIGLSIIKEKSFLLDAIIEAFKYDKKIIIEKYISGDELTVGILEDKPLAVVRINPKGGVYSFEAKYTQGMTEYEVPAMLEKDLYKKVQKLALLSHLALGCRDFSRVDLRLGPDRNLWVLEVNTIPGFTATSLLPKSAQAMGIGFEDLCERMLSLALKRKSIVETPAVAGI